VQRSKLPKPQLVRGASLDLIRYAEERSSRNSERFRQLPSKANHDGDFRSEPARDTPTFPLDSWQRIAGQEIVELLEIDVEGVSNCRQIINRQYSSCWRIK
jgi:hypothetical protein